MLNFQEKIDLAIHDLKFYCPPEGYYVAFSGGKDSVVMYNLIKRSGVKYKAVHNYISIEPPPLIDFIKAEYPEVEIEYPPMNMEELIIKNGIPPLRHIRYCHRELKKGGENMVKVLGIRAQEGRKRANRPKFGGNKFGGYDLNLIIDWTEQDIWRYIFKFDVPYCSLYDKGRKRIGCLFCPYGSSKQMLMDLQQFPEIATNLINACQAAIERRVARGKPIGKYTTGYEMFFNWIGGGHSTPSQIENLKNIYESSINAKK